MSNRALTWAFAQPIDSAGRKFTLVALADMADESNSCWPLQETLATMTGQSSRSVREHLRQLEGAGYISRIAQRRGGHRISDRYTLLVSVAVGITKPLPAESSGSQAANLAGSQAANISGSQPENLAKPTGKSRQVNPHKRTLKKNASAKPPQRREDVERLCTLLANRIEGNGSKRPTITAKWRDAARLMIDTDKRTEEQITRAITWCQDSEFWRANILSMPKLRERYETLRLQAKRSVGKPEPEPVKHRRLSGDFAEWKAQQAEIDAAPAPWK